jgi:hypothetical protein
VRKVRGDNHLIVPRTLARSPFGSSSNAPGLAVRSLCAAERWCHKLDPSLDHTQTRAIGGVVHSNLASQRAGSGAVTLSVLVHRRAVESERTAQSVPPHSAAPECDVALCGSRIETAFELRQNSSGNLRAAGEHQRVETGELVAIATLPVHGARACE